MTTPIAQAKALLQSVPYTKDLADCVVGYPDHDPSYWTAPRIASSLAASFSYQVAIDPLWAPDRSRASCWTQRGGIPSGHERHQVRITNEDAVPLGASKYRGIPHLPPGMEWPEGLYFGAQLNLAELAKVDCSDRLPKDGMLYVFYNLAEEFQVVHWRGRVEGLERRAYPPRSAFPDARHYYDEFMAGERIDFKPYWLLIFNEGEAYDHPEARRILPPDRIEAISSVLGAPLSDWDCSRRIYGRRVGDFEISGFDERGDPIWDDPESRVVLFHDQIADTFLHLWCSPEAAARGDFSQVECTGWCS